MKALVASSVVALWAMPQASGVRVLKQQKACMEFVVIGDQGYREPQQTENVPGMNKVAQKLNPLAFIGTGDNFYDYGAESTGMIDQWFYDTYPGKYASMKKPWFFVMGNHDYERTKSSPQRQIDYTKKNKFWTMPGFYYKQKYEQGGVSVEFFFFDTQLEKGDSDAKKALGSGKASTIRSEQQKWLDKQLKDSTADWKVVVGHYPMRAYSLKNKNIGGGGGMSTTWNSIKKYADAYVCGHVHDKHFILDHGITYIISGAGAMKRKSSPKQSVKDSKCKAFYNDGGVVSLSFCSKTEATSTIWSHCGNEQFKIAIKQSQNKNRMLSSEDYISENSDIPSCMGKPMKDVDHVCDDGCTVVSQAWPEVTCEEYCQSNGLSCKAAWATHEEDCLDASVRVELACDEADIANAKTHKKCQCGLR